MQWIMVIGAAMMSLSRLGQAQERFALTTEKIAQALADKGIRVSEEQVILVAKVVATDPSPSLDVLSVASFGSRLAADHPETRTWIRMACHRPGTCLPFYAIVVGSEGQDASKVFGVTKRPSPRSSLPDSKSEVTIQAGAHATLILDDRRSQIRVSVISLERGTAGSMIRVASSDHKHVYVAEVMSSDQLKASF